MSWGRLIFPLLWLPFLGVKSRRELFTLTSAVYFVFVWGFSGVAFHPVARSNPLISAFTFLVTCVIAILYTVYNLAGVWLLPLDRKPAWFRLSVWIAVALLIEWALETSRHPITVPIYFLTDGGGLFPMNLLVQVWGAWAGAWLWGWGLILVAFWRDPMLRRLRWLAPLVWVGTMLWAMGHPPKVQQIEGNELVLVSPGVMYDAAVQVYESRYLTILQRLGERVERQDTAWLVFPEGTFGTAAMPLEVEENYRRFWEEVRRRAPVPVGVEWHATVWVDGKKHSRLMFELPSGDRWLYEKRVPFIGGEKYVPLVSDFLGDRREPGDPHQKGFVMPSSSWSFHTVICNESLFLTLVEPSSSKRGIILAPSEYGWMYAPLFLKSISLRHRAVVTHTGLPLCSSQREGGLVCYFPEGGKIRAIGEPWGQGPGWIEVPLWVGQWNPAASHAGLLLWGWIGVSLILGFGAWYASKREVGSVRESLPAHKGGTLLEQPKDGEA